MRQRRSQIQEQTIAHLKARLEAREHELSELAGANQHLRECLPRLGLSYTPNLHTEALEEKIQQLQNELQTNQRTFQATLQYVEQQKLADSSPRRSLNTPGPHKMQEKAARPDDVELQQKLQAQSHAEATLHATNTSADPHSSNPNQNLVDLFRQIALVMKDSNTSDTLLNLPLLTVAMANGTNSILNFERTCLPKTG